MPLFDLFIQAMILALQAVGGVMATIPALQALNLMPAETLTHLVAIGQASPGPNMLLIPLFGWQIAGVSGALIAALGFCIPSATLVLLTYKHWRSFKKSVWKSDVQSLFGAIGAAAVMLSTVSFMRLAGVSMASVVFVVVIAALALKTKLPPIALIIAGGAFGALGVI